MAFEYANKMSKMVIYMYIHLYLKKISWKEHSQLKRLFYSLVDFFPPFIEQYIKFRLWKYR